MAKYHGKLGYILLEKVGIVGQTHGWSISSSKDISDTPQQGEEWNESIRGQGHWSGSFTAWYNGTNMGEFYNLMESSASADMYLYPQKSDLTKYFYGDVWADFDMDVPVDGAIDISATVTGTGQLLRSGL